MPASVKPSHSALRRAAELGCDMARHDSFFRPDVSRASRYDDYWRFRNAHREQWEQTDRFVRVWLDKLFVIAEKERKRLGLRMDDSIAAWDAWYNQLVMPMKRLLWEAWEQSCDLPARYAEAAHPIAAAEDMPLSSVLRLVDAYAAQFDEELGRASAGDAPA
jgi:hypothetical protein